MRLWSISLRTASMVDMRLWSKPNPTVCVGGIIMLCEQFDSDHGRLVEVKGYDKDFMSASEKEREQKSNDHESKSDFVHDIIIICKQCTCNN
mmetsp:Transcript_1822/g.3583  ORF Transcript_1822/g.3583 Transcript_1822/m.3583 type:complete len:92 (+) Transcript_1822:128-403(+)